MVIFCHFQVKGTENLKDLKKPFIAAIATHATYIDGYIVGAGFDFNTEVFPLRYMTVERYIKMPILGTILKTYGAFPVRLGLGVESGTELAHTLLKKGDAIGMFIEGKLSKDGNNNHPKPGAAYLSIKSGFPVLPISLTGNFGFNLSSFIFRKKYVTITFNKPIYPRELGFSYKENPGIKEDEVDQLTQLIMAKIKENL